MSRPLQTWIIQEGDLVFLGLKSIFNEGKFETLKVYSDMPKIAQGFYSHGYLILKIVANTINILPPKKQILITRIPAIDLMKNTQNLKFSSLTVVSNGLKLPMGLSFSSTGFYLSEKPEPVSWAKKKITNPQNGKVRNGKVGNGEIRVSLVKKKNQNFLFIASKGLPRLWCRTFSGSKSRTLSGENIKFAVAKSEDVWVVPDGEGLIQDSFHNSPGIDASVDLKMEFINDTFVQLKSKRSIMGIVINLREENSLLENSNVILKTPSQYQILDKWFYQPYRRPNLDKFTITQKKYKKSFSFVLPSDNSKDIFEFCVGASSTYFSVLVRNDEISLTDSHTREFRKIKIHNENGMLRLTRPKLVPINLYIIRGSTFHSIYGGEQEINDSYFQAEDGDLLILSSIKWNPTEYEPSRVLFSGEKTIVGRIRSYQH